MKRGKVLRKKLSNLFLTKFLSTIIAVIKIACYYLSLSLIDIIKNIIFKMFPSFQMCEKEMG